MYEHDAKLLSKKGIHVAFIEFDNVSADLAGNCSRSPTQKMMAKKGLRPGSSDCSFSCPPLLPLNLKRVQGRLGWLSWLSDQLSVCTQVMISGCGVEPHVWLPAPWEVHLGFSLLLLPLSLPLLALLLALTLSL